MKGLLHWLSASPLRMGLAAAALALSRLFDLFGAAVIGLAALRGGLGAGTQVIAVALPLVIAVSLFSGLGLPLVYAVLVLWLPVLGLSLVLRKTGSLALTMQAGALLVSSVVAAWYVFDAAPMASMREFLETQVMPLFSQLEGQQTPGDAQLEAMTRLAPGMMAAGVLLIFSLAVLVARWWQAIGFNPGGFQYDFHRLRQGRTTALLVAVLVLIAMFTGHPVAGGFAFAGAITLLLQGIAMVHGVVAATGQPAAWLWGMYALLVLLPLPTTVLLMVSGGVDNWLDFRRRAGQDAVQ